MVSNTPKQKATPKLVEPRFSSNFFGLHFVANYLLLQTIFCTIGIKMASFIQKVSKYKAKLSLWSPTTSTRKKEKWACIFLHVARLLKIRTRGLLKVACLLKIRARGFLNVACLLKIRTRGLIKVARLLEIRACGLVKVARLLKIRTRGLLKVACLLKIRARDFLRVALLLEIRTREKE